MKTSMEFMQHTETEFTGPSAKHSHMFLVLCACASPHPFDTETLVILTSCYH